MRRRVRDIGEPQKSPITMDSRDAIRHGAWRWGQLAVMLLPTLIALALFVVSPAVRQPLPLEKGREEQQKGEPKGVDASLMPLLVEEAFLKNRLAMAKTDSVALTLDLVDSLMTLDIKGVPVRLCKIEGYDLSGGLKRARRSPHLSKWLTRPFVLQKEFGTIAKAPIKRVDAPRDTVEAEKLANMTPPPDSGDVAFVLDFTRNLTVRVRQSERLSAEGRMRELTMKGRYRLARLITDLRGLPRGQWPTAPLVVSITVPRADAKAVYRALPHHALLAFRL